MYFAQLQKGTTYKMLKIHQKIDQTEIVSNPLSTEVLFAEEDADIPQCSYCGHGMPDKSNTLWVQCDVCHMWVH